MNFKVKKHLFNLLYVIGMIAAILLVWYIVSITVDKELIAPSPWTVIALTFTLLGKGTTYLALLSTLLRSLIAFAVSLITALCLSLFAGLFPIAKRITDNIVTVFRALPTMAIILVTLIVFTSATVPAIVAFLVAFPIIYSAFQREIYSDLKLLELCKIYGVSRRNKVRYVLLPHIGSAVVPQTRDTLPLCIKVVIAGEAMSLPKLGLGRDMYIGKVNLDTANVLALTLLALAVCFVIEGVVSICVKKATK